jgi:ornithine cyclodeaminase/alanine dehydrogenase-like protein (mu-crystallin family)
LVILNDPATGLPTWIMDAARITAVRTAAVSGVAIRLLRPGGFERVAILGAGIQARSHLEVLHSLAPSAAVVIYDRNRDRAETLAAEAAAAGIDASVAGDAHEAAGSAGVVVTVATLGATSQVMTRDWVAPGTLVVAVDFATYVSAELARAARIFVVDDREQFLAYRDTGYFDGYPGPGATIGELLDAGATGTSGVQPAAVDVVTHLGVGLADVVLAAALAGTAETLGVGTELRR